MNMQKLMAEAQKMQRDITKKQSELESTIFEGKSEWIELSMNGKYEMKSFKITYNGPIEEDDKEMLEDMINIALTDAIKKINNQKEKMMSSYGSMGGLF
ncbi:MAG: YbaB/EbfC family nucleoid-associated protein [Firmicutes bacterium]|nr:YbaB/EbfC family nucleoid-associated protein [Bacillota bacterium]